MVLFTNKCIYYLKIISFYLIISMESPKVTTKPIPIPKNSKNEIKLLFPDIEKSRDNLKKLFGLSKTPEGGLYADK